MVTDGLRDEALLREVCAFLGPIDVCALSLSSRVLAPIFSLRPWRFVDLEGLHMHARNTFHAPRFSVVHLSAALQRKCVFCGGPFRGKFNVTSQEYAHTKCIIARQNTDSHVKPAFFSDDDVFGFECRRLALISSHKDKTKHVRETRKIKRRLIMSALGIKTVKDLDALISYNPLFGSTRVALYDSDHALCKDDMAKPRHLHFIFSAETFSPKVFIEFHRCAVLSAEMGKRFTLRAKNMGDGLVAKRSRDDHECDIDRCVRLGRFGCHRGLCALCCKRRCEH